MKKLFKLLLKLTLGFIAFILIYIVLAFGLSKIPVNNLDSRTAIPPSNIEIFILSNGVHTDIVVPVKNEICDWFKKVNPEYTIAKDSLSTYLAMGWGDKGFYLETPTWDDLKFSTAFKAATGLSTSAMHCTFYKTMKVGKDCKSIMISESDYKSLIEYIQKSFQQQGENFIPIVTNAVYGKNDVFYEANGSYNLFYTCNTWTNSALKAANQKAALWTPYEGGIFQHYE
ncbi:MAG: TIGR02117 family protein [Limnohabitans sp.]|nr:TIGR02117 family protein [Limnohabitans sp.]